MKQKLCRRLEELERFSAAAAARRASMLPTNSSWLEELRAQLDAWHAVPENQAWVASHPPEWFGTQVRRLREEIAALAEGRAVPVWPAT